MEERNLRKTRVGVVVSDKMDKTIVVAVRTNERHPLYNKIVKKTYKLKAHDENNDAKIGDTVKVMETRPLSKDKRWRLVEIMESAIYLSKSHAILLGRMICVGDAPAEHYRKGGYKHGTAGKQTQSRR